MGFRAMTGRVAGVCLLLIVCSAGWCAATAANVDDPVERSVRDLQSTSPDVREGGEVRLYSLGPKSFPAMEAASRRADLPPDAVARLKEIVDRVRPLIGARLRWDRLREADQRWNERTSLAAYDAVGRKNPKWDALARRGIQLFVSISAVDRANSRQFLEKAIAAGCDDPLVLYFEARCAGITGAADPEALELLYRRAARGLLTSEYPPFRKAMAVWQCLNVILNPPSPQAPANGPMPQDKAKEVGQLFAAGDALLDQAMREPQLPPAMANQLVPVALRVTTFNLRRDKETEFKHLYDLFDAANPHTIAPLVFKGRFYVDYAWDGRGSGYASSVTPERWKVFAQRLSVAAEALNLAYQMDPHDPAAPTEMLQVELGQGKGRDVMEMWFKRAMKANPDNLDACNRKLYYLQPKWYGDPGQMIDFGRECRDSKNWYGRIPFVLTEAHENVAELTKHPDAYFHHPAVWEDVVSVFRPYLNAFPDDTWDRSRLCYLACKCGQWAEARRQFEMLGDKADPERFDSEQQMRQFRQQAMNEKSVAP